jgi:hypothetical protein
MADPADKVREALLLQSMDPAGIPRQVYDLQRAAGNPQRELDPRLLLGQVPGSNYTEFSRYRVPGQPIQGYERPTSYNYAGFTQIGPNTPWVLDQRASTHAHEVTHVDQNDANKRLGDFSVSQRPEVAGHKFQVLYDLQNALGYRGDPKELLARLREKEAMMPAGAHIWEHPELKGLVTTEADRKLLEELMFPQTTFAGPTPRSRIMQFLDPNNKLEWLH